MPSPRSTALAVVVVALPAAALAALACGGSDLLLPGDSRAAAIAILTGNNQTALAGSPLPDSLVVRVTDPQNRPVLQQRVAFVATGTGGGTLDPDTATTDADGRAGAMWTLGAGAGVKTAEARVVGSSDGLKATFTATATTLEVSASRSTVTADPTQIPVVTGTSTVTVVVRDRSGAPIPGSTVTVAASDPTGILFPASATTDQDGVATFTFRATATKKYTVSARADGVAINQTATVQVTKALSSTAITGVSPDPPRALAPMQVGFAVTGSLSGTAPTGTVTVSLSGESTTCTAPAAAGGCSLTPATAGDKTLTASYPGDGSYEPSAGSAQRTVQPVPTSTTLTSKPNPSKLQVAVTFTAQVGADAGRPAGSVIFAENGCPPGGLTLGTGELSSKSIATFSTTNLGVGTHTIVACYTGSATHAPSTSPPLVQQVQFFF